MYEIHVAIAIEAPAERVFAALVDYERFFRGPQMSCRLVRQGREHPGGLGAVRQVTTGGMIFTEEITAFDPPRHFEYVVRSLVDARGKAVRMRHERGWLDVAPGGPATRVDWHSRFAVTLPIVGWFVERAVGPRAGTGFGQLLDQAKTDLGGRRTNVTT